MQDMDRLDLYLVYHFNWGIIRNYFENGTFNIKENWRKINLGTGRK